ncbi:STAS/SEC14 domain-containing protein [Roseiconus nitratireducens]|uniref:STAS/SEC14 domain-containing protein n=1 Tax=Roseiconus nitratireducens TaxID=2605748 RepID=A0A5M6CYE2_9BACT|nr:STAS/SEC14 domain-containing protein [Roseiconus nitratireducens]KAA5539012.1 STAS/SEC14 domain-containing protein [Roseiconus nitratireducens]
MLEHSLDTEHGVLHLSPQGRLTADDFKSVAEQIDPFIEENGCLNGLMISADRFPGWSDFSTMVEHFRFVRDHHRKIRRVAIVSDDDVLSALPHIASHFIAAEVEHFGTAQRSEAANWLNAVTAG